MISIRDLYYIITLPFRILKDLTFDVYMLSDKTKKIIYIASVSVGTTKYLVDRLYNDDVTITKIKRIYIWELRKFVKGQDMVLADIHKSFIQLFDDGFIVPEFVSQILEIDDNDIKLNNKNLKRVRKYDYDISNDPDALKFFYEKMYVPYAKKKYGDSVYTDNFNNIEKFFRNGELLFIKFNGEYVSAQLSEINGDTYRLRRNGVLDENFVKGGALVAAYYFSIQRAKEINAKNVDFGGSKPFLLDGVLRHKNVWGTKICEAKAAKRFIYLKNVLFQQPFIYIENKKLKAAIFSEDDKLIKEYAESGLEFKLIEKDQNKYTITQNIL